MKRRNWVDDSGHLLLPLLQLGTPGETTLTRSPEKFLKMHLLSFWLLASTTVLGSLATVYASRTLSAVEPTRKQKDSYDTQGSAYSHSQGNDPGGPGDAFTWYNAESSSAYYNGLYYKDGKVTVEAGDKSKGTWAGAIVKNDPDQETTAAVASNFDPEYSFQRGVHTISGTYEGARAVAGSGSMFGVANNGIATATIDAYAPTAQDNVAVGTRKRSVAHTNIAPTSAAQSGTGNGPAAVASGWEVASAARAARDKPAPVTVGSRVPGDTGHDRQQKWFASHAGSIAASGGREHMKRRRLLIRGVAVHA